MRLKERARALRQAGINVTIEDIPARLRPGAPPLAARGKPKDYSAMYTAQGRLHKRPQAQVRGGTINKG